MVLWGPAAGWGSGSEGFAAPPYLLDVGPDAATVAFHLREPMPAEVIVFDGSESARFPSPTNGVTHYIHVAPLAPGQTYRYQVVCGDGAVSTPGGDDSYQITTACRPGETFSFAVYGDPRPGDNRTTWYHEQVVAQMLPHEPAFCLALGDMVDDGSREGLWEQFFAVASPVLRRAALFPVFGDNDYSRGRGLLARYFPPFARGYYHFTWGGVHFFALHAWDALGAQPESEFGAHSPQTRWLETELARPDVQQAPFRVVFTHDPIFICRGASSETLRRVWGELFRKYRVDVVFASWHLYERSQHDGVTYLISGGGGAELLWPNRNPEFPSQVEARQHHFCRVDVKEGALRIRAIARDGTVLDNVTLLPRPMEKVEREPPE